MIRRELFIRKRLFLLGLSIFIMLPAYSVWSQEVKGLSLAGGSPVANVAFIDLVKIMNQSLAARSLNEQASKVAEEQNEIVNKKNEELSQTHDLLESRKSSLSKSTYESRLKAWEDQQQSLRKDLELRNRLFSEAYEKVRERIKRELLSVVTEIAKESNINLIFDAQAVYAGDENMDITLLVMRELDKRLSSVTFRVDFEG